MTTVSLTLFTVYYEIQHYNTQHTNKNVTPSINATQHNNKNTKQHKWHSSKTLHACLMLVCWVAFKLSVPNCFIDMMSVIMLNIVKLSFLYWKSLWWMLVCWVSFWWMSFCWVLLCWVSFRWMSFSWVSWHLHLNYIVAGNAGASQSGDPYGAP